MLGHTPYLSRSFRCVCLCRQILAEMSRHISIFGGFITSLLDDIHVILWHNPYPPGSSEICLFVHTIVIERMSLVMKFLGFHHVLIDATLGHIPYLPESFRGGWFVQTVLIDDMSHCYDIFGLHHVYVGCRTRAYPSNFAFTIFSSNVQTSSSTYQAFKLHLHMDQMFRLRLLHIMRSNFAFIWIKCSDFICITFASTADQTFIFHLLHIRRSDFTFIWIRCSFFICITFASTSDQMFRLRFLHIRRSDFAFVWIGCSDFICITFASKADKMFRLCFLYIRHLDFAFIWIKCSDFICITFASIAD